MRGRKRNFYNFFVMSPFLPCFLVREIVTRENSRWIQSRKAFLSCIINFCNSLSSTSSWGFSVKDSKQHFKSFPILWKSVQGWERMEKIQKSSKRNLLIYSLFHIDIWCKNEEGNSSNSLANINFQNGLVCLCRRDGE